MPRRSGRDPGAAKLITANQAARAQTMADDTGHGPGLAGAAGPVVSRRREASHSSARSVLMTVLGEYVLPRDQPVWTSVLVDTLASFGVEEKSARQALARAAAEGWLVSERVGRRARWLLTSPGRRLLTEGAERIYAFGSGERPWDGRWLLLLVSVPEVKRDLRHRLRTRLSWAGFGSPEAGVWISPDLGREGEALEVLKELGLAAGAMSFTASYGTVGGQDAMVSRAWDLTGLERRYEEFIAGFAGREPAGRAAVLHAQTSLVHAWRRFPFVDPQLPRELLPANWSGAQAAALFHRRHTQWRATAEQYWDELAGRPAG
jgi:phenylacetic acid degradation operon negative regulatory protein